MNIKLPYSWIKDYLITDTKPEEVFRLLTQIGPTVERVEKLKDDFILDIEVTINRPDCLSVLGIAREMYVALIQNGHSAKLTNDYLSKPPSVAIPKGVSKVPFNFTIDSKLCPRFMGVVLKDVKIETSPKFIIERLEKAGMRGLNNVVDITNFIMLELGQPNHAFDYNKIKCPGFTIRSAKKGETLVTLDGNTRLLDNGDIIYEDEEKIFDLSGIMGGLPSEIDSNTTEIFFTVVNDYFAQIRKTSMRLGIQTEASSRLTKVLNPEVVLPTFYRGLELLNKYANAKISSEVYDFYPNKQIAPSITITDGLINRITGISIPGKTADSILTNLGFKVERSKTSAFVTPPIWRINDTQLPEDIVEEITRVFCYDNITNQPPIFELPIANKKNQKQFIVETRLRHLLVDQGFFETMSFSMLSQKNLTSCHLTATNNQTIVNPLTEEWVFMQSTILPNALKNIALNPNKKLSMFEMATIFDDKGSETNSLAIYQNHGDFYTLKGYIEQIFTLLHVKDIDYIIADDIHFTNPESVQIAQNGKTFGKIGMVKPEISHAYGIDKPIYFAELDLNYSAVNSPSAVQSTPLSSFSPIIEDISLIIPPNISYKQISDVILSIKNITSGELIDRFDNRFTFRINYQLPDKQISSVESTKIRETLLATLDKQLGVRLRRE